MSMHERLSMTRTEHGNRRSSSSRLWSWGRRALAIGAVLAIVSVGTAASAQESPGTPDEDDEEVGGPLDEELDNYWSVDRDVDVIQEKLYKREGRFAVGLFGGLMSSEPFFWYTPVGARADYYITDQWGIEVEGMFMGSVFRHDTDLTNFLQDSRDNAFTTEEDTLDQFQWRAHALAVWHPLYGKLAFLQRKLAHFDINLAAGFGAVSVNRPDVASGGARSGSSTALEPNFVFGGGVKFFINNHFVLRLEGRGNLYRGAMRYKNKELGSRQVSKPATTVDAKELNFIQRLNFTADFLAGVSYMF